MILKYTVISQAMEKNNAVIKHVNKFCPREIGIKWGSRNKKYVCQEERFWHFPLPIFIKSATFVYRNGVYYHLYADVRNDSLKW